MLCVLSFRAFFFSFFFFWFYCIIYIGNGSLLAFLMHIWLKGNHSAFQPFSSQLSKSPWPCVVLHGGLILAFKPCLNIIIILTLLLILTQWIWWHTRGAKLRYRHTDVKRKLNWNSENSPMNHVFYEQSGLVMNFFDIFSFV